MLIRVAIQVKVQSSSPVHYRQAVILISVLVCHASYWYAW